MKTTTSGYKTPWKNDWRKSVWAEIGRRIAAALAVKTMRTNGGLPACPPR